MPQIWRFNFWISFSLSFSKELLLLLFVLFTKKPNKKVRNIFAILLLLDEKKIKWKVEWRQILLYVCVWETYLLFKLWFGLYIIVFFSLSLSLISPLTFAFNYHNFVFFSFYLQNKKKTIFFRLKFISLLLFVFNKQLEKQKKEREKRQ